MPAQFQSPDIFFLYPENWNLDEEECLGDQQSVTVYSPAGGFWSVGYHPGSADPLQLANAALDAMKEEYKKIDIEEIRETVGGRELVGFDLNFFFMDLTNTAHIRSFKGPRGTYSLFYQAEDGEFEQIHKVFQAMIFSLIGNIKDLNYWNKDS
jgi:hypothetical protein